MTDARLRATLTMVILALGLAACEGNTPICHPGQMKIDGSVDQELLLYKRSCEDSCWTFPFDDVCAATCVPPMSFEGPNGVLVGDRRLMLTKVTNAALHSGYVLSFGYVDELGGTAPNGWGFLAEGPRSYLGDTLDGSARFVIEMVATRIDPASNIQSFTDVMTSSPGRLEILKVTDTRIGGRFFVGFDSPTQQAGGELLGCFDLTVNDLVGNLYQLLTPN